MDGIDLESIVIVFENVEILELKPCDFYSILIEDITSKLYLNQYGQISDMLTAKLVKLRFYKNNINMDRLYQYKDIVSIDFKYKHNIEVRVFVDWNDEDEYENINQVNEELEEYIEITIKE